MPFALLPDETLLNILSFASPVETENLAKTFNRRIYRVCVGTDSLQRLLSRRRNARAFEELRLDETSRNDSSSEADSVRLDEEKIGTSASMHRVDHIDFDGSFSWMDHSLPKAVEDRINIPDETSFETHREILLQRTQDLKRQATKIGLVIPGDFLALMSDPLRLLMLAKLSDEASQEKTRSTRMFIRHIGPSGNILRFHPGCGKLAKGYIIPFWIYSEQCGTLVLYLDRDGVHGVMRVLKQRRLVEFLESGKTSSFSVGTVFDKNNVPFVPIDGLKVTAHEHAGFEEYLASKYFSKLEMIAGECSKETAGSDSSLFAQYGPQRDWEYKIWGTETKFPPQIAHVGEDDIEWTVYEAFECTLGMRSQPVRGG